MSNRQIEFGPSPANRPQEMVSGQRSGHLALIPCFSWNTWKGRLNYLWADLRLNQRYLHPSNQEKQDTGPAWGDGKGIGGLSKGDFPSGGVNQRTSARGWERHVDRGLRRNSLVREAGAGQLAGNWLRSCPFPAHQEGAPVVEVQPAPGRQDQETVRVAVVGAGHEPGQPAVVPW